MYFYVDESGNTGANLFDSSQPRLYYGVLSSRSNLDIVADTYLARLRKRFKVKRLHAAEMGNRKIALMAKDLSVIQRNFGVCFDIYYVVKEDHAVIAFFDQVFDQGVNPAVTWSGYWTPLRYMLLLKVASLFDRDLALKAWSARIELNNTKAEEGLVCVCQEIRGRVDKVPDRRAQQIIRDALHWAERNPDKIGYNVSSPRDILSVTPNVIGFQFVMQSIATRITENNLQASKIVVDQQSQFNKAQRSLAEFYANTRDLKCRIGPGMPEIDLSAMPTTPIDFASGNDSAGLELVDIYLWVFKRLLEGKQIIPEMRLIIRPQLHIGRTDEISLNGLSKRWIPWFNKLYQEYPELTEEQMKKASELMAIDEMRRSHAVRDDT